jgi:hypothetical protein
LQTAAIACAAHAKPNRRRTANDVKSRAKAKRNGDATPPQPRERQPSVAARKREEMLLNRPKLKPVDNGRPSGAEALEQAPGYPPGMTKGMVYTDTYGRVETRSHEEVARAKLYDRLIEFNALIRQLVKADAWPTYDDLATLDDRAALFRQPRHQSGQYQWPHPDMDAIERAS